MKRLFPTRSWKQSFHLILNDGVATRTALNSGKEAVLLFLGSYGYNFFSTFYGLPALPYRFDLGLWFLWCCSISTISWFAAWFKMAEESLFINIDTKYFKPPCYISFNRMYFLCSLHIGSC